MDKYSHLREFCITRRQHEVLDALEESLTVTECAESLGIIERNVYRTLSGLKKRAGKVAQGEHFIGETHLKDTGLGVKGTTTMYGKDGMPILQWVKAQQEIAEQYEAFLETLNDDLKHLKSHYKKIEAPKNTIARQITNYKTTDLHFGALIWHEETGHDYDLDIARETLLEAGKYLISTAPPTKKCIISDNGDMVEADDYSNMTKRSKNVLDVDGRYPKVFRVVRDTYIDLICMALEKHEEVEVIFVKGNHDDVTSFMIQEFLSAWFRNEPRVNVDTRLTPRKYYLHGSTLLGFTHGHEMKPSACGEVMAHDCREVFHKTTHRYFSFGHMHKSTSGENVICFWEVEKNLPPSNAWATGMGFVSQMGTMRAVVYDSEHGECDRHTFSVSRLKSDDNVSEESRTL